MKRTIVTIALTTSMTLSAFAATNYRGLIDPDDWNAIEAESLDQDELVEAFDALRDLYENAYQLYLDALLEGTTPIGSGTADTEAAPADDVWALKYYVDEFDQPTEDPYITNPTLFVGTFDNSATSGSPVSVQVLVDPDSVGFILYEYQDKSMVVSNGYSKERKYSISILDPNKVKHEFIGTMYSKSSRILIFDHDDMVEITSILQLPGSISMIIDERGRYSKYKVTFETGNFDSLFEELK